MGYRNFYSRLGKAILLFLILLLGFVGRVELFHMELGMDLYATNKSMICDIPEEKFTAFIEDVEQDARKIDVFCFFMSYSGTDIAKEYVFYVSDESAIDTFADVNGIKEGQFDSLLSGTANVEIKTFAEASYRDFTSDSCLGIIGNDEQVLDFHEAVSARGYDVGYPDFMQGKETDMPIVIWGFIAVMTVVINVSAVLRRKKEITLEYIYGRDLQRMTAVQILLDVIMFELLYFIARAFVFYCFDGDYAALTTFVIYQLGTVAACAANLMYLRCDVRAVLSNVTDNAKAPRLLYVIKILIFAASVFTLVMNLWSIRRSIGGTNDIADVYSDSSFLTITANAYEGEETDDESIWDELYENSYEDIRPVIAYCIANDSTSCLIYNDNALDLLPDSLKMQVQEGDSDITICCSKREHITDADAEGLLHFCVENSDKLSYETVTYDESEFVPAIDAQERINFGTYYNPIIIYCSTTAHYTSYITMNNRGIVYDISDEFYSKLCERCEKEGYSITRMRMDDYSAYQKSFLRQLVRFLSSLCVFVLILEFVIASEACRIYYHVNGMEMAIKKTLGYTFWDRNRRQLLGSFLPDVILSAVIIIACLVTGRCSVGTALVSSALAIVADVAFLIIQIIRMERVSVKKILKGDHL